MASASAKQRFQIPAERFPTVRADLFDTLRGGPRPRSFGGVEHAQQRLPVDLILRTIAAARQQFHHQQMACGRDRHGQTRADRSKRVAARSVTARRLRSITVFGASAYGEPAIEELFDLAVGCLGVLAAQRLAADGHGRRPQVESGLEALVSDVHQE